MKQLIAGAGVLMFAAGLMRAQAPAPRSVALAELAWPDAEGWLTASSVVVIPLGAGAVAQGPHMKLDADERLARHLAGRARAASSIVVAPPLNYHFYPAYAEYPGSTSLSANTARDVTVDAVRGLARFGPRRFYVINTSASTLGPLSAAARVLADAGILLGYTDPGYWTKLPGVLKQTPIATAHAEEAATSMLLFVDPSSVDMTRAKREYPARGGRSASGVAGDATLATAQKGEALVSALLAGVLADIEKVRTEPLPSARTSAPPADEPPPPPRPAPPPPQERRMPNGCTAGEDRTIRRVGEQFTYLWAQQDALNLTALFTKMADIRHPDGSIERGQEVILANRIQLFSRREYQNSKHPLQLNDVRCLGSEVALADGKWELRLSEEAQSTPGHGLIPGRLNSGWCTLIMLKNGDTWKIEAWRYTINPPVGTPPPVLLSKPGYIGRGGH